MSMCVSVHMISVCIFAVSIYNCSCWFLVYAYVNVYVSIVCPCLCHCLFPLMSVPDDILTVVLVPLLI